MKETSKGAINETKRLMKRNETKRTNATMVLFLVAWIYFPDQNMFKTLEINIFHHNLSFPGRKKGIGDFANWPYRVSIPPTIGEIGSVLYMSLR